MLVHLLQLRNLDEILSGLLGGAEPQPHKQVARIAPTGMPNLSYPGSGTPTLAQLHTYLRSLYTSLLADPAISGITLGAHWDQTQPSAGTDPSSFNWTYIDDAFASAAAAQKTVQLIVTPGFDSPPWLIAQIPSCDPGFLPPEVRLQLRDGDLCRPSGSAALRRKRAPFAVEQCLPSRVDSLPGPLSTHATAPIPLCRDCRRRCDRCVRRVDPARHQ